jgi:alkanesulfonate monooxygenase SsuD/methylene tetrahydromethanopterin reductase-like flavin-dependent oxidoreductase (luciferase family)
VQLPHPPIGVAGLSPNSSTLKLAGERGFLPMSLNLNASYLGSHWSAYEEGAHSKGLTPLRSSWRVVREIFVAETDEEAFRLSARGMMGRMMDEYLLPLLKDFQFAHYYKHDQTVTDHDVTAEYCARHNWLIGSPATVAQKLEAMWNEVGGFGTLLVLGFDYADTPDAWYNSLRLLANEVLPRVKHLRVD